MKYLKYILGIILLIVLIFIIVLRIGYHEPRPEIIEGNAEMMAQNMLDAVNKEAWDTLSYISWSFRGEHHYVWDRVNNNAIVKWSDNEVHLNPDEVDGLVFKGDNKIEGNDASNAIQKAWGYWCNDMFWLAAPYKIKDPGTQLSIAKDNNGKEGLLVSYQSGGVTPGDAYLWYLDESGRPTGYKMWVKIIPLGGVYTSWEKWESLEGGAKVSTFHQGTLDALKIEISNIKAGDSWEDLGYKESPIKL